MSRTEILEYLERCPRQKLSAKQIAEGMGRGVRCVCRSINSLRKDGFVKYRVERRNNHDQAVYWVTKTEVKR